MSLYNKRIVIAGGSSGIGLATARAAAAEGARIFIVSGRQSSIDNALQDLPATAEGQATDLSKEENIRSLFENIGRFDHLVYTAGENISLQKIGDMEIGSARQYFNIRYWGAVASVKYGAPWINPGGSITLTSGTANHRPGAGWSLGAGICGAMEGFTRAIAVELAPIRVNIVCPGVTRTNLWNSLPDSDRESLFSQLGSALPVRRVGEAEDVAQSYLYCMKQDFGTGQVIVVDGGAVLV